MIADKIVTSSDKKLTSIGVMKELFKEYSLLYISDLRVLFFKPNNKILIIKIENR